MALYAGTPRLYFIAKITAVPIIIYTCASFADVRCLDLRASDRFPGREITFTPRRGVNVYNKLL